MPHLNSLYSFAFCFAYSDVSFITSWSTEHREVWSLSYRSCLKKHNVWDFCPYLKTAFFSPKLDIQDQSKVWTPLLIQCFFSVFLLLKRTLHVSCPIKLRIYCIPTLHSYNTTEDLKHIRKPRNSTNYPCFYT